MSHRLIALAAAVALVVLAGPAEARKPKHGDLRYGSHVEEQLQHHRHYVSKAGHDVHAPAKHVIGGAVPDGATARCRSGDYSFSHSRRGTCSRQGGVAGWLR